MPDDFRTQVQGFLAEQSEPWPTECPDVERDRERLGLARLFQRLPAGSPAYHRCVDLVEGCDA